ncbi:hypothetical protein ACWF9G_24840 [Nocardia sp. NPDC055029]|uniref:hypothetical protein n=1 Tax=unclassified Nocardia TaxID=2637762 RepID=UPI0036660DE2
MRWAIPPPTRRAYRDSGRLRLAFAEFVQVKKSYQEVGAASADKWSIELDQLNILLTTSPTAAYWLIGADGEIYTVPAKLIYGLASGAKALNQAAFTLHYTTFAMPRSVWPDTSPTSLSEPGPATRRRKASRKPGVDEIIASQTRVPMDDLAPPPLDRPAATGGQPPNSGGYGASPCPLLLRRLLPEPQEPAAAAEPA